MEGRLLTLKGGAVVSSTAPPAQGASAPRLLAVNQLSKAFPGTRALDDVTLELRSGRITALVGHNGSGKSTLVKILAGVYEPDNDGCITDGEGSQRWCERIHFIHQDLGLIGDLNAVENLDLASTLGLRHLAPAKTRAERASARALVARFGVELDVTTPIRNLSPAERSIVAIGRALQHWDDDQQVLVLDEPTASLQDKEVEVLLNVVTRIAERGAAVLYISHRLDEVAKLADDVVVLRDGQVVDRLERGGFTSRSLVESITGHAPDEGSAASPASRDRAKPALTVRGLTGPTLKGIDIEVSRSEIVGISGVIGSGIEDVLGSIFGAIPRRVETFDIGGQPAECTTPAAAVRAGMGFVPRDRHRHGAILEFPARENLTLPKLKPLRRFLGGISGAREKTEAAVWFERADVRPGDPERRIAQFSGGNQQKVVLSKWIRNNPAVLLLEEPTQGVDAGAQDTIYRLVRDAAEHGAGVLVASSDTKELVRLCDRVLVLNSGRVVAELSGGDLTEHHLIRRTLASEPTSDMNDRETP